jgi:hypothetical protein
VLILGTVNTTADPFAQPEKQSAKRALDQRITAELHQHFNSNSCQTCSSCPSSSSIVILTGSKCALADVVRCRHQSSHCVFSASATVSGSATTTSMPSLGNGFLMDELSASYQEHHERK